MEVFSEDTAADTVMMKMLTSPNGIYIGVGLHTFEVSQIKRGASAPYSWPPNHGTSVDLQQPAIRTM